MPGLRGHAWKLSRFLPLLIAPAVLFVVILAGSATVPPVVTTDQTSYSSGETVIISGSGFTNNGFYDVVVTRPDGTIIKGDGTGTPPSWDTVQADGTGAFTYNYTLDGISGTYTVDVYDKPWAGPGSGQTPLATTTFMDDSPYPTSISAVYNSGTGVLAVSGMYSWPSCPNSNKAAGFAIFINGATPSAPGAGALDGSNVVNTMHPVNMTSYFFPCASSGSWGPDNHTLASAPTSVCVVLYDVHGGNLPPSTGTHSTVGAGTNHNGDNSYENPVPSGKPQNAYSAAACTTPATVTPTPVPTNSPTPVPTNSPTPVPTNSPTPVPTNSPTPVPTNSPTPVPTNSPTPVPTNSPTPAPTNSPTPAPTNSPTPVPTNSPTPAPTHSPTPVPTNSPTPVPTNSPTPSPTQHIENGSPTPTSTGAVGGLVDLTTASGGNGGSGATALLAGLLIALVAMGLAGVAARRGSTLR